MRCDGVREMENTGDDIARGGNSNEGLSLIGAQRQG